MVEKSRTLKFRKKGGKRNNKSKKYRQRGGAARIINVHLGCMNWTAIETDFLASAMVSITGQVPPPNAFSYKEPHTNDDWKSGRFPNPGKESDIYLYENPHEPLKSMGHYQNFFYKLFDTFYVWDTTVYKIRAVSFKDLGVNNTDLLEIMKAAISKKEVIADYRQATDPIYKTAYKIIFGNVPNVPGDQQETNSVNEKFVEKLQAYATSRAGAALTGNINMRDIVLEDLKNPELQLIILAYGVLIDKHIARVTSSSMRTLIGKADNNDELNEVIANLPRPALLDGLTTALGPAQDIININLRLQTELVTSAGADDPDIPEIDISTQLSDQYDWFNVLNLAFQNTSLIHTSLIHTLTTADTPFDSFIYGTDVDNLAQSTQIGLLNPDDGIILFHTVVTHYIVQLLRAFGNIPDRSLASSLTPSLPLLITSGLLENEDPVEGREPDRGFDEQKGDGEGDAGQKEAAEIFRTQLTAVLKQLKEQVPQTNAKAVPQPYTERDFRMKKMKKKWVQTSLGNNLQLRGRGVAAAGAADHDADVDVRKLVCFVYKIQNIPTKKLLESEQTGRNIIERLSREVLEEGKNKEEVKKMVEKKSGKGSYEKIIDELKVWLDENFPNENFPNENFP